MLMQPEGSDIVYYTEGGKKIACQNTTDLANVQAALKAPGTVAAVSAGFAAQFEDG
jgi:hypothetical protein